MSSNDLLVSQSGAILRITLNRPDQGNGVTDAMAETFTRTLADAHARCDMVVLDANGPDFCIGRAPRDPKAPAPHPEAYRRRDEYDVIFNAYGAMKSAKVPIIGVIHGRTMGFGTAITALCDVSFASDAATFNIPEMSHNVMPTMVMSALQDRIARNVIAWMTYSTDFISAERAMGYGFVSTVVPAARLTAEVDAFLEKMVNTPRAAILGLKEYLRAAPRMDAQGATDFARSLHSLVNTAADMQSRQRKKHKS